MSPEASAIAGDQSMEELRRELAEAREQQAATAGILAAISNSPTDAYLVFAEIAASAARLCDAYDAGVLQRDGEDLRLVAHHGPITAVGPVGQGTLPLKRGVLTGRAVLDRQTLHVADLQAETVEYPEGSEFARRLGHRTILVVPLLRAGQAIGAIYIRRTEVRPFTDRQIDLLKTFADQAVIAIENTRLFEAEQASKRELQESLEYQTATSDVLNVISRSPSNLQPVLDAIVKTAARLCQADFANFRLLRDGVYHLAATTADEGTRAKFGPGIIAGRGSVTGRAALEQRPVHAPDVRADPEYTYVPAVNWRTVLSVPLLRDGVAVGVIVLFKRLVKPFNQKQIALVSTFANQALIAIENTRLFEEVQARTGELSDALERQTATSEVLNVISRSPNQLQPVLDSIVATAADLCQADFAMIHRLEHGKFRLVAANKVESDYITWLAQNPPTAGPGSVSGRAVAECATIHIPDVLADPEYSRTRAESLKRGNQRTTLGVPLLREGVPIGVIALHRTELRPFTDKQIELVTTFADQAVIAIENTRLFEAEQARTNELTESLEYQTALADVLGIISRSPSDLQPVLNAIAASARRLCSASDAVIERLEADRFYNAAHSGTQMKGLVGLPLPLTRQFPGGRAVLDRKAVIIDDIEMVAESEYPDALDLLKLNTIHSVAEVPLLSEGRPLGSLAILRAEVRPFTNKEIAMLESFASQAVIAIENTRLFEEVQARTRDLTDSLEQQTATSEVLGAISRSKFDLQPVLDTLVASAAHLCDAPMVAIHVQRDNSLPGRARRGFSADMVEALANIDQVMGRGSLAGRTIGEGHPVHIPDVEADAEYTFHEYTRITGARSMLGVPLLHDGRPVGLISLYRTRVAPFTPRQIELMATFADQAEIAIENTRLFEAEQASKRELQQSLEYQTATSDVLGVISRSPNKVQPVLDTIVQTAQRLCQSDRAQFFMLEDGKYRLAAYIGTNPDFLRYLSENPISAEPGSGSTTGRAARERRTIHVPDTFADPEAASSDLNRTGRGRSVLGVPLLRGDVAIGVILVARETVKPFTEAQIELVETFADQALIAIENVRLFEEIAQKSRELEIASQHKSQFVANISHELRTPLAAILGYAELMQEGFYEPQGKKSLDALTRIRSNGKHLLGLINTVLDIAKIKSGQFSLNLGEYAVESVVETVRAATKSLAETKKLTLKTDVTKKLPVGLGDEQRLTQVLLNLVGNAIKFTDKGEVRITATANNGHFTVAVTDTGPGIAQEHQARVFEQFHQIDNSNTKAKGGTGLGLAIAKQIVEMHGGRIWVESMMGQGSTFRMELPVRAAAVAVTA